MLWLDGSPQNQQVWRELKGMSICRGAFGLILVQRFILLHHRKVDSSTSGVTRPKQTLSLI